MTMIPAGSVMWSSPAGICGLGGVEPRDWNIGYFTSTFQV